VLFDADQPVNVEFVIQHTAPNRYKAPMATCIACAGSCQHHNSTVMQTKKEEQ
jgi:hypothetical protein